MIKTFIISNRINSGLNKFLFITVVKLCTNTIRHSNANDLTLVSKCTCFRRQQLSEINRLTVNNVKLLKYMSKYPELCSKIPLIWKKIKEVV